MADTVIRNYREEHIRGRNLMFLLKRFTGISEEEADLKQLDIESFLIGDGLHGFPYRKDVIGKITEEGVVPENAADVLRLFWEFFEEKDPAGGARAGGAPEPEISVNGEAYLFLRLCWFKTFYPKEFYAAMFSVFREYMDLDYAELAGGQRKLEVHQREIEDYERRYGFSEKNGDDWMEDELEILRLAAECRDSGIRILPADINRSEASVFAVEEDGIRIPFDLREELLRIHAEEILERRREKPFVSAAELREFLSDGEIEVLERQHALEQLDGKKKKAFRPMGEVMGRMDFLSRLYRENRIDRAEPAEGPVLSGFTGLDRLTGGFQPGCVYHVAGRPGIGKTAFLLNLARWAAGKQKLPVRYVCIDQSMEMTVSRLVGQTLGLDPGAVQCDLTRELQKDRLGTVRDRLYAMPVYLCEEYAELADLEAALREEADGGIVIIDSLDRLEIHDDAKPGRGNGETADSYREALNRRLRHLAQDLRVPVIAAVPVSRSLESRRDKHPKLSDCPAARAGEQYIDGVLALFREAYYDPEGKRDVMEAELLKSPGGETGRFRLKYDDVTGSLSNICFTSEK